MVKNNIEVDVKVKCIEIGKTQVQIAEEFHTTSQYVNRIIKKKDENSSNNVYRLIDGNRNLFAKIYGSNAVHTDYECMIYEDVEGSALADLLDTQSLDEKTAIVVVQAFIDFVSILNTVPTTGYEYLKGSFHGSHDRYMDYL